MPNKVLFDLFNTVVYDASENPGSHHLLPKITAKYAREDSIYPDLLTSPEALPGQLEKFGLPESAAKKAAKLIDDKLDDYQLVGRITSVLDQLRERGFKLGLISNLQSGASRVVDRLRLDRYFDTISYSFKEGAAKPDPRFFWDTIRRLDPGSSRPEECVMVGDHWAYDILGGLAAGLHTYWVEGESSDIDRSGMNRLIPFINRIQEGQTAQTGGKRLRQEVRVPPGLTSDFLKPLRQNTSVELVGDTEEAVDKVRELLLGNNFIKVRDRDQKQTHIRISTSLTSVAKPYIPTLYVTDRLEQRVQQLGVGFVEHFLSNRNHFGVKLGHVDLEDDYAPLRIIGSLARLATPVTLPYWKRAFAAKGIPQGPLKTITVPETFGLQDYGIPMLAALNAATTPQDDLAAMIALDNGALNLVQLGGLPPPVFGGNFVHF